MRPPITQSEANALVQKGFAALQNSRPQKALQAFDHLIGLGVVNVSIWLGKAYACNDLGEYERMLNAIDKSIALQPRNPRAFLLKADHFKNKGDRAAALAFYRQALNVAPPPEQTPADLKPELARAQQEYNKLTSGFTAHLETKMAPLFDEVGSDACRVEHSIDLITRKRQYYTSQPQNYFFPELPNIQFYDASKLDWVPEVEAATEDIRRELLALLGDDDLFASYVTEEKNRPQSDPHGMMGNDDWSAFYLWKDGEQVTENVARCPKTAEVILKVPFTNVEGRSPNILFSRLKPGAKIPPHYGQINTRFICHLPIIVPAGCGFRVGNETREWQEGKVWVFDDTIEHEAWNNSDQSRYILLFEVWRPELTETEKRLVTKLYDVIDSY